MVKKVIGSGTIDLLLGSDHRGESLKREIMDWIFLDKEDMAPYEIMMSGNTYDPPIAVMYDVGTYDNKKKCDYPNIVKKFANHFDIYSHGILICGSGFGVCIAANRFKNIRAVVCRDRYDVEVARQHNNMNVMCLGADYTDIDTSKYLIEDFINTKFEGGRHQKRVNMLKRINK